ncbi:Bug family tripartite tricarboxylate transporter substrate binding protein [Bordetella bronchialis]|nr:tripartite tricarboxylate transporter substrate binding protein [Bordetella bronchialis]
MTHAALFASAHGGSKTLSSDMRPPRAGLPRALRWIAALALAAGAQAGHAAGYPDRAITWVVPYPPGGTTDVIARNLAQAMGPILGQSIVVENKAGAGGQTAMAYVARATPDGYTLLVSDASVATAPSLYPSMPFDPAKDLKAVALFVTVPHLLVVNPSLKADSLKALIALTEKEPGKINFSSGGIGSPLQLAGEALRLETGLKWTHIPYKGAGPALMAAVSGEAQVATPSLPAALPQVQAGKLRALAVTSPQRIALLPDVPTVAELGYPKATVFGWVGLHAPAGTPPQVVQTLDAAARKAMQDPALLERLKGQGAENAYRDSSGYDKLVTEEAARWKRVVQEAGIKPE